MRFGKLIDGELKNPPGMLPDVPRTFPPEEEGGEPITGLYQVGYSPADTPAYVEAYLLENGYLPVVEEAPEAPEGQHYVPGEWTEENGQIVRTWRLVDDPDPLEEEIDAERAIGIVLEGRDPYDAA